MKNSFPWWIRVPILFFLIFGLMEYFIDSGDQPAVIAYPVTQFFLLMVLILLIAIELVVKSVENIMVRTLSDEAKERYFAQKQEGEWEWGKKMMARLTHSRAIEEEGEIILDHNYDGIRELNNTLPPWWVGLFWVTIIFGGIYLVRFHILGDYTQKEEFQSDMAAAFQEVEAYKATAKDLVDANSVELLTDANDLSAGKTIFETNCVACHMSDGGGGIGPNLTDQYWILGGGIKEVFHTISEGGRDGKGMVAWKQSLKPAEIAQVASYVLTAFPGTTPANPKEAQGEVWQDPNAPAPSTETVPEQTIDSVTTITETEQ